MKALIASIINGLSKILPYLAAYFAGKKSEESKNAKNEAKIRKRQAEAAKRVPSDKRSFLDYLRNKF